MGSVMYMHMQSPAGAAPPKPGLERLTRSVPNPLATTRGLCNMREEGDEGVERKKEKKGSCTCADN